MPADSSQSNRLKPVLVILHQEHSTPGRVGLRLQARGHKLDVRRPRFGDPLPETMTDHAGAVIFGGPMSVNDDEDYLRREVDWMAVPLKEEAPLLGLCLGAQMIARHLGADVRKHADGMVEIGYYSLKATDAGAKLLEWPDRVHHFHNEGFELPAGATLLAEGDTFTNQAFVYGPSAYGFQFHVELTTAMVNRWTGRIGDRASLPNAQARELHFHGRALHDWKTASFLDRFLELWLAGRKAA